MSRKVSLKVLGYSRHAIWTPKSAKIQLPKIHPQHLERELSSSIKVNNCQRPAPMIFFFSTKDHTKYPTLTTFWHLKITDVFSQCGKTPRKLLNVSLRKSTKTGRSSQTNFILDHMIIAWSSYDVRWGSVGFLHNVGTRASVMFFLKTFIFLLFKDTKSHQKAMSKVRTIVCCSKYPA